MKIKTRKKSRLVEALDDLGRPTETEGYVGSGLYRYSYITNKIVELDLDTDLIRFYQDETTYIELSPNKGWLTARGLGAGLEGLVVRGQASNSLELKVVHRRLDGDGEDVTWD